jgi:hypothetical protein
MVFYLPANRSMHLIGRRRASLCVGGGVVSGEASMQEGPIFSCLIVVVLG